MGSYEVNTQEKAGNTNEGNKDASRSSWDKPLEFVLSCLNYAIGLGNVWRFPYLCYRNGGGAFLVAYFVMLLLMGTPIFLLELLIGQYSGLGPDLAFKHIAPLFTGLGYCCLTVVFFITVYYMIIVAWTVFYFFASFTLDLGYGKCNHDFSSIGCYSAIEERKCELTQTFYNKTCTSTESICQQFDMTAVNRTYCSSSNGEVTSISRLVTRTLATEEYFREYVLGIGDATWENFGNMRWELFGCLLFSWLVCYIAVLKGVKTSGKAVYFTVPFPYVILTALVIQGVILEGAMDGIKLYITPVWERLLEVDVWASAASQTFYSFGTGCGSLITLASYNHFTNNCLRDALIVTFANAFTSVYAGVAIFSMLGFLALQMDVPVAEVAQDGPGLAFVAYPEAILLLPGSTAWSLLFFLMLFILGLGTQFAGVEAVSCSVMDRWPKFRNYESYLTLSICGICLVLAIPMCFSGGVYIFTLMEWNTASWAIMLIGFGEVVACSWSYGSLRFIDNMNEMKIRAKGVIKWYWWTCWVIITPLSLIAIFVFQMTHYSPASYGDYIFPKWADYLGVLVGITTLVPFVVFLAYVLWKREHTGWQLFLPTQHWKSQIHSSESQQTLADEKVITDPNEKF